MKICKNDFIAVYDPTEFENLKMCLVRETPEEDEEEIKVIFLRKINDEYTFEVGDSGIAKLSYLMGVSRSFQMGTTAREDSNLEEELEGLEVFFTGKKREFRSWVKEQSRVVEKRISSAIEEEEDEGVKRKVSRKKLKIVGKKDDSEVRKKIKISKKATVVVESKKQRIKKRTPRARKPKPEKFRRGKNNPLIKSVVPGSIQMDSDSDRISSDCCTMCTNKELIRAITRDRRKLFDAIFKKKEAISSLNGTQGVGTFENPFSIALHSTNPYYFEKLIGIAFNEKKPFNMRTFYSQPTAYRINVIETGSNDKYAYGVKTRQVQVSRGNREGNNALLKDTIYNSHGQVPIAGPRSIVKVLTRLKRTKFIHEISIKNHQFQSFLKGNFCRIVECGNVEMAAFVAKIVTKYGGYGFSNYHLLALVLNFDPAPVIEEEKKKLAKLKAEDKLKALEPIPEPATPAAGFSRRRRKMKYRKYHPRKAYTDTGAHVALKYEDEFLTRDEMVQLLLKMRKANVTKKAHTNNQITPLHCACINPNPHALRHFLNIGDDLSVYDEMLRKPVHYAACSPSPENLKVLLDKGVDLRDSDKIRKTPLMYAAEHGRLENVKLIVESMEIFLDGKCRTARGAIHFAAEGGHFDVLKYLIDKGANMEVTGPNRQSVISLAAMIGNYQMVSYLLEKGAKQLKSDKYGKTPLIHAVQNGHLKIANLLLKYGALYEKPDSSGNTPLHYAAAYGFYEMIDLLVRAGADINTVNSWNLTPVTIALLKNHFRCVKEFLKHENINVNCQDNNGFTLLMHAISLFTPQSFDFAEHLLDQKGADITIKTYSGNNAFHNFAMKFPNSQISVNQQQNPVQYAKAVKSAAELYKRFFDLMIAYGANPNEKNLGGFTPLSICLSNGNTNFLKLLTENADLRVDHVVKDKSELHYLTEIIMREDTPEILEKLLLKTSNFGLLMQLYDLNTGFNIFHAVLNRVVNEYFSYLDKKQLSRFSEFQKTVQLLNKLKQGTQSKTKRAMGIAAHNTMQIEEEAGVEDDELLAKLEEAEKKAERAQLRSESEPTKKTLISFLEKKLETVKSRYTRVYMQREENRLQERLEKIFESFKKRGYDLSQKVRLYKRKIEKKSLEQTTNSNYNHYSYRNQNQRFNNSDPNANAHFEQWKNKDYKVNRLAKSSVFHLIMKKANVFLFKYFKRNLRWKRNILNYRGESLINTLVKNYHAGTPSMDLKIYNKDYDRLAYLQQLEEEKKKKSQAEKIQEEEKNLDSMNLFSGGFGGQSQGFGGSGFGKYTFGKTARKSVGYKRPRKKRAYKKTARGFGNFGNNNTNNNNSKIQKGFAMPTESNEKYQWTDLNDRRENETLQVIGELLKKGENPDLEDKFGNLPILKVALNGGNDLLHLLIQNGTNLNVLDRNGQNPLLLFAKRRDLKSCEYLIANLADIGMSDLSGRNALHWSLNNTDASSSSNFDLEELLINSGVKVNQKDKRGLTPVNYLFTKIGSAFIKEKLDPIEILSYMLSQNTISLEEEDRYGNRLLHYAAQRGAYLCVLYLLRAKAEVNVYNKVGNTPFNISLQNSHNDVAIILLQHNAQVNDKVYQVDYESMRKYHIEKRKRAKEKRERQKEKEQTQSEPIEEEEEDEEAEEEVVENRELENETGLVEEAIMDRFKEHEESEDEDEWNPSQATKRGSSRRSEPKRKETRYGDEDKISESEFDDDEEEQNNNPYAYHHNYQVYNFANAYHNNNQWMKNQMRQQLKDKLRTEKEKKDTWKKLEKLFKRNFVTKVSSQFKVALENSMLSVNFLLVDFGFELGQAVMDAFSLHNFSYAKTLLNKKVQPTRFKFNDAKGRNLVHYLASFGGSASGSDMDYFMDAIRRLGLDLNVKDCLGRTPAHYAALNNHLQFIERLHEGGIELGDCDVFDNNLLSLFMRKNNPDTAKIRLFVQEYSNNVDCVFKEPLQESISEIEKFELIEHTSAEIQKKIKEALKSGKKTAAWGWKDEVKAREGKTVREHKKAGFKKWSLLMYVALKKKNMSSVQGLIDLGADLNAKDLEGKTLLAHAIKNNDEKLMELLKNQEDKIDFGVRDNTKASYLHMVVNPYFSATFRNMDMLKFLLPRVDNSLRDNTNRTALSYAQSQDDQSMAEAILENAPSNSKRKKFEKESKSAILNLPSSVIHAEPEPVACKYDFKKDAEKYIAQSDASEKRKAAEEKIDWEERVLRGLDPAADKRVEGKMRVVKVDGTDRFWNVNLVKVDIKYSRWSQNLFYKMQLLKDVHKDLYILFTNWGRVGTGGQYQQTPFFRLDEGQKEFCKIFREKTKNDFDNIENFEKKRRKYNLVKLSLKPKASKILRPFELLNEKMPRSGLLPQMQDLMRALSDDKMFKLAYSTFRVEDSALPFGRLDKSVLLKARDLLLNIQSLLNKAEKSYQTAELNSRLQIYEEISQLSSDYYELVPNSQFKETMVPAFKNGSVEQAIKVVINLIDFEVVSKMLCGAQLRVNVMHPYDYIYQSIGTRITPVDMRSEEAELIKLAIGHQSAANSREKYVQNIFAVNREEDSDRFKSLDNRRMLWHGTKTENLISILHKGLMIAPSCADKNGSKFGNGIYFSDNFDSSLLYCANHYYQSQGCSVFILFCEVSLGKMRRLYNPKSLKKPGTGYDSVKGSGRKSHPKSQHLYLNNGCRLNIGAQSDKIARKQGNSTALGGLVNPGFGQSAVSFKRAMKKKPLRNWNKMGKQLIGLKNGKKGGAKNLIKKYELQNNEFVVYNPNQVKIRYLIQINKNMA